jgi:hypothetical protein
VYGPLRQDALEDVSSRQEELKGENAELATQNEVLRQDSEALERSVRRCVSFLVSFFLNHRWLHAFNRTQTAHSPSHFH